MRWSTMPATASSSRFSIATYKAWTRTLALNVTALAMACKAAGRVMREQRSGRIVNITSPGSRMALPDYTAYTASKAGVDSITRAAAVALAPYGVLVNSLAPGMMDTEMQRSTEARPRARSTAATTCRPFSTNARARIPLGRRAEITEVAEAVVWLALDAPSYMTAERLNMSGGPRQGLIVDAAQLSSRRRRHRRARAARNQSAAPHADHGARAGPGLYRPGPGHRRRAGGALFPRASLRPAGSRSGPNAIASCCRPAIIRSRSGPRWRRRGSYRSTNWRPMAPTTAGSRCRRSTPRPASR